MRDVSFREAFIVVICMTMGVVCGFAGLIYLVKLM